MAFVVNGIVCRTTARIKHKALSNTHRVKNAKKSLRDWYFVKSNDTGTKGVIEIKRIFFPKHYIGKHIRLTVEVVK